MYFVLDVIIISIIVAVIIVSAKRGCNKMAMESVCFISAIVLSFIISTTLAGVTYDKIIKRSMIATVEKSGCTPNRVADVAYEAMPELFQTKAVYSSFYFTELVDAKVDEGYASAVNFAADEALLGTIVKYTGLFYSIIFCIILFIAAKLVSMALNKRMTLRVTGKLNHILGGVAGLFEGWVFAIFFCLILSFIASIIKIENHQFLYESVSNSKAFAIITALTPFYIWAYYS